MTQIYVGMELEYTIFVATKKLHPATISHIS